jgi:hypothetical protein
LLKIDEGTTTSYGVVVFKNMTWPGNYIFTFQINKSIAKIYLEKNKMIKFVEKKKY